MFEVDRVVTMETDLRTWRCQRCRRILFRAVLPPGTVVQLEHECHQMNLIHIPQLTEEEVRV